MCKIYCDSCVYIDLFEGRKDKFRDLGDFALNVFRKVREKHYKLVISDWVLEELTKHEHDKHFNEFIETFEKESINEVKQTSEDKRKANTLSKDNYPDALHVVLAKKANCIYLVTTNIQHFAEFRDVIEIILPQSL